MVVIIHAEDQIAVRIGVAGLDRQGLTIADQCLIKKSQILKRGAKVAMRRGMAGRQVSAAR
jgi:hypothetical protein